MFQKLHIDLEDHKMCWRKRKQHKVDHFGVCLSDAVMLHLPAMLRFWLASLKFSMVMCHCYRLIHWCCCYLLSHK